MTCKNHCKNHVLTTILDYAVGDLTKHRALARKLKVMAFSRNWEIRQAYTKDRRYGWQQGIFFFSFTTCRTLQNAVLGNKYFKA